MNGLKCPKCGNTNVVPSGCCGGKKYKCPKCKYIAYKERFER